MADSEIIPHGSVLAGKKPNKIIPVAPEYRRFTHARERDVLVNDIKVKTDCHLVPHWEQGKISQFDIYGSGAWIEEAEVLINKWILSAHVKSKDSSAWAKTPAFDSDQWYYDRVAEMEGDRRKIFLASKPGDSQGVARLPSAIVDWPEDLRNHPVTPRDVFGNKLEALNDLRMRDEVWITLLPNNNGLWQVEIIGFEVFKVDVAEDHYRTMIEQARTNILGVQHTLNIILDEREGIDVVLEEAEDWWPNRVDTIVPRLLSSPMMYEPGSFRRDSLHHTQLSVLQHTFHQALEGVRGRRGSYDFAVRLGCLALGSQKMPDDQIGRNFQKEEFLKAINSRVDLLVKKWAFDDELGGEVLRRLVAADTFLEPSKSSGYFGIFPASLKQTRPMYRGTWVFRDPNGSVPPLAAPVRYLGRPAIQYNAPQPPVMPPPSSLFVVQVDWTEEEEGLYEKADTRFYKLELGKSAPKLNMDINLLELGEGRGWHFGLESLLPVSRKLVSPILAGFAERVAMKPKYDPTSMESFAQWDMTPTIKKHLQNGRLDKIYAFGIQNSCYKVELTAMWYPQQRLPVWGLAVCHTEWATHLAELERLPVGCRAEWGHTLTKFLPDDGLTSSVSNDDDDLGLMQLALGSEQEAAPRDGIRVLMEKLMQLSDIVNSVSAGQGGVLV